jgi:hypothetical protein
METEVKTPKKYLQPTSASGFPTCIYCGGPISAAEMKKMTFFGKKALFCCNDHKIVFAQEVAERIYKPASIRDLSETPPVLQAEKGVRRVKREAAAPNGKQPERKPEKKLPKLPPPKIAQLAMILAEQLEKRTLGGRTKI